jgi:hypothetical protein
VNGIFQWFNRKHRELSALIRYRADINSLLTKIKPVAVVSSSDRSLSDQIVQNWCFKNKIPYIILQPAIMDGAIYTKHQSKLLYPIQFIIYNKILKMPFFNKQNLYGNETNKTHLFLWSEYFILNKHRKNMHFVGSPAFDHLFKAFKKHREIKNTVLICTEDIDAFLGEEIFNEVIEIYETAITTFKELTFYIKVHPREPKEKYETIFPSSKYNNVKVLKDENLYDIFEFTDVQLSVNSTTLIEAAAMGIPIITITPDSIYSKIKDFFKGEINIRVSKPAEIVNAINYTLSEPFWNKFLKMREKYYKRLLRYIDASSSKRTAEVIESIIHKTN